MATTKEMMPAATSAAAGSGALVGKHCVVMGIQNRWSIAWAIAEAMAAAGARLAVTYLDDRAKRDADTLVAATPDAVAYRCIVESDEELDALGEALARDFGRIDGLVHSIAFAPQAEL